MTMKKAHLINPLTKEKTPMKVQKLKEKKLTDVEEAKQKVRDKGKPQRKTRDGKKKQSK